MDLILWRHAEAEPGVPDHDRPLTAKGRKQAQRMAGWLERHLPDGCRILVSPATRAQQTAGALDRRFRTVDGIAAGADATAILKAVGWPGARHPALVVGHQPALGEVASLLVSGEARGWSIRKGAVWWLSDRHREGGNVVLVRAVLGPDLV